MSIGFCDVNENGEPIHGRVRSPRSRERFVTECKGESLTHQSFKESSDVNNIIKRYERTGQLPLATRTGFYGDVSGFQGDLTERLVHAQETIAKADEFLVTRDKRKRQAAADAEAAAAAKAHEAAAVKS